MLNTIFNGIFDSATTTVITVPQFILCLIVAICIGVFLAFTYTRIGRTSQSFLVTVSLIPAIVCVIIMVVNGNIGAGIAVAGTFSLVRFRSYPGTAKDIGTIFLAMAAGLMCGMGYLAYAVLFAVILCLAMVLLSHIHFQGNKPDLNKTLRITIPEDLNYDDVFNDIMEQYTSKCEILSVKTTNMGSMFKLTYHIILKDSANEKAFIDDLRCRNGNLEISISRQEDILYEL